MNKEELIELKSLLVGICGLDLSKSTIERATKSLKVIEQEQLLIQLVSQRSELFADQDSK